MTGIDRVERAYLHRFLAEDRPVFGLVRTKIGYLLLDRSGCAALLSLTDQAGDLPAPDLLSRLSYRGDPLRARAETLVRRLAFKRVAPWRLRGVLADVAKGGVYYNVGHAHLEKKSLTAIRFAGLRASVLIHDTIPLEHPNFARAGSVAPFRQKISAVAAQADRVIHLSQATRRLTEAQLTRLGRVPEGVVAPLGVERPNAAMDLVPPQLDLSRPYFVVLGTIEPRKNHALLLDVWSVLPDPKPQLFIIGNRGWADPSLLARLDNLPPDGPISALHGLQDGAVAALVQGARALLAPSRAEGFGLPPVEAALLGTPVIASDLAVTQEILGDKAVYLSPDDIYSWVETIKAHADRRIGPDAGSFSAPSLPWADHFKVVLRDGW